MGTNAVSAELATHLPAIEALRAQYTAAKVKMREADAANDARRAAGTIDGGAAYAAAYAAWNTWEALGARLRAAEMRLGLSATY